MRVKPKALATAVVLVVPALGLWAALIYVCHTLVTGTAVVLELISRSLN